jgi:dipeptidyl aminopeptidase/acylaminoacyl peptidase
MMLSIHGGPHSAFGYCYNHQFQIAAAKGYAVLFVNPRGSTHYGQDFAKATHHDWGGKDYRDIMAGVEHALRLGYVDESRMVVTGASFGGYMTNWVIAHDNRFKAAVTEVTTANRYSQWGSSDYGHGNGKWEFKGRPWESWDNAHHYLERSPLTYVQQMDTPLLILQAMADQRCPLQQAEELYTALVVLKKNVEMVLFPGESHTFFRVGKPKHRKERLERVFAWFDRYTCT